MAVRRAPPRRSAPFAVAAALLALLAVAPAGAQQDDSLGIAPGRLEVADAQPATTSHHQVVLQNGFDTEGQFAVETSGEAGAWAGVDAGTSFTVPANAQRALDVTLTPPDGTGPGLRQGQLTFCRQADDPDGSGAVVGTRVCVGVLLNVTVGGERRESIVWLGAAAKDAQVGTTLLANATARNAGNVRTTATARAVVTPLAGGAPVAHGNGSVTLDPGQTGAAEIALGASLPIGQYLVNVTSVEPPGFQATVDVKVTAEGVAPDGTLRAILNDVRVPAGEPVEIRAWFESTGDVGVQAARFNAKVYRGDAIVATLGSDAEPVAAGAHANLTALWTPAKGGAYRIVGHVEYDGFRTPEQEGRIEVGPAAAADWLLVALVVAVIAAVAVVLVAVWRRSRRKR